MVLAERGGGVPKAACEVAVGCGEELVAVGFALADEEHPGWCFPVEQGGVAPPPGEEGVVAAELLVVLVDPGGAVVLDQEQPAAFAVVARDLEQRVGGDGAWPRS